MKLIKRIPAVIWVILIAQSLTIAALSYMVQEQHKDIMTLGGLVREYMGVGACKH